MSETTLLDFMEAPAEERVYRFSCLPSAPSNAVKATRAPRRSPKPKKVTPEPIIYPDIADTGNWLFCDGGVIGSNPSLRGGTWAWVRVENGKVVAQDSGVLLPSEVGQEIVTNNNSELYAICRGIEQMPELWSGMVASDSKIALGWVCMNFSAANVPPLFQDRLKVARAWYKRPRTVKEYCDEVAVRGYMNLAGHPKSADLEAQRRISKAPHLPVSRFNVLCDALCNERAKEFLAKPGEALR